jgi:hypothetical protein
MRTVVEWDEPLIISATNQTLTFTWSSADVTGTWTGKVRSEGPEGTDQSLTVTVSASYSTNTTISVALTGSQLAALIPSGDREWSGWLGFSRSDSPIKGMQGPIKVRQVVNR